MIRYTLSLHDTFNSVVSFVYLFVMQVINMYSAAVITELDVIVGNIFLILDSAACVRTQY